MELFDIVDENALPTGRTAPREQAHTEGLPHRTSHVWILRRNAASGRLEVLLQKRSKGKDSFPGCYDISSAGHIPAGEDFIPSAIRELEEELGVTCRPEDLIYCGRRHIQFEETFHGKPFRDNEYSNIYLLWMDKEENEFTPQTEEIESVKWFGTEECMQALRANTIPHCIYEEELQMALDAAGAFGTGSV